MAEPRRRRLRSVRARATAGAVLVVAIALVLGGIGFVAILHLELASSARSAAETDAESIAAQVPGLGAGAISRLDDDAVVQLVDAAGAVVASTEEARGSHLAQAAGRVVIDDDHYLLVSEPVDGGSGTVWVGYELDDDAVTVVVQLLMISIPLLVALVGGTTWLVTGRALAPVQRIRTEVEAISVAALDRRVPVPATEDEVASLAATMNRMLDRLERGARTQRQFVSDASHELRSPLATIRQHAELGTSHPHLLDGAELCDVVLAEGQRMQELVDSLLLLARLDEGPSMDWAGVDLDDLALAEASRARSRPIDVDGSGIGAARVHGDSRLLSRVARNLVDNALRHAEHRIAIVVGTDGADATFVVEDDGSGVPPGQRDRVFERFARLDESRARDEGGTGLGLAIVQAIVRAHGGSVTIGESRWHGARFTVRLPIERAPTIS